jgi:hypothetical protein
MGQAWSPSLQGPARYGLAPVGPASPAQTELHAVASPGLAGKQVGQLFHPDNPLLAFLVLGGITFGLMGFATSVRVGKTTSSLNLGKA